MPAHHWAQAFFDSIYFFFGALIFQGQGEIAVAAFDIEGHDEHDHFLTPEIELVVV